MLSLALVAHLLVGGGSRLVVSFKKACIPLILLVEPAAVWSQSPETLKVVISLAAAPASKQEAVVWF